MKKLLALILALAMLLTFAACDKKSDFDDDDGDSASNAPKIPSVVSEQIKDYYADDGFDVDNLKEEYTQSKDGASMYIISGKIIGSSFDEDDDDYDEDIEDYKDGYFICLAYEYDGDVDCASYGVYEKDEKDSFEEELFDRIENIKDNKDEYDDLLEAIAEGY